MSGTDTLIAAAKAVDVMDAAGRIIANPHRHAPEATAAEVLALAWAAEGLNAIVIEAELLVRALMQSSSKFTSEADFDRRDRAIAAQIDVLLQQFATLRSTQPRSEQENDHADSN